MLVLISPASSMNWLRCRVAGPPSSSRTDRSECSARPSPARDKTPEIRTAWSWPRRSLPTRRCRCGEQLLQLVDQRDVHRAVGVFQNLRGSRGRGPRDQAGQQHVLGRHPRADHRGGRGGGPGRGGSPRARWRSCRPRAGAPTRATTSSRASSSTAPSTPASRSAS